MSRGVVTREIANCLESRCRMEKKLLNASITLVSSSIQLSSLLTNLWPPHLTVQQWHLVPSDEPAKYQELLQLLQAIEGAARSYEYSCMLVGESENAKAIQLPGVSEVIREVYGLFNIMPNPLAEPIIAILSRWRSTCPFLFSPVALEGISRPSAN
ncbi:hypothetical protein AN958_04264 [Leucoagaricus sp. SymC.cos]|nr:hypothetical protein AN958_04264 [Leucoagaricus sp. SymC.cos]